MLLRKTKIVQRQFLSVIVVFLSGFSAFKRKLCYLKINKWMNNVMSNCVKIFDWELHCSEYVSKQVWMNMGFCDSVYLCSIEAYKYRTAANKSTLSLTYFSSFINSRHYCCPFFSYVTKPNCFEWMLIRPDPNFDKLSRL